MFGLGGNKGKPKIRRVEAVVNCASGSVGRGAPAELETLLAGHKLDVNLHSLDVGGDVIGAVRAAVSAKPDLVIVLAGDGTARAAAELAGPHGPLLAPLPGGTMNMLPHAIYGVRPWQAALEEILEHGAVRNVGGGQINGHSFYVAAILGSPALFAEAREAVRHGQVFEALRRARWAARQAFSGRLRFDFDKGPRGKAAAVTLLCPLISSVLSDDEKALEAAALDVNSALDVFKLAYTAAVRDWREDPAVRVGLCRHGQVWASGQIPAILDGETVEIGRRGEIHYRPIAFRALAPKKDPHAHDVDAPVG